MLTNFRIMQPGLECNSHIPSSGDYVLCNSIPDRPVRLVQICGKYGNCQIKITVNSSHGNLELTCACLQHCSTASLMAYQGLLCQLGSTNYQYQIHHLHTSPKSTTAEHTKMIQGLTSNTG